jgi:hypothetical protein
LARGDLDLNSLESLMDNSGTGNSGPKAPSDSLDSNVRTRHVVREVPTIAIRPHLSPAVEPFFVANSL